MKAQPLLVRVPVVIFAVLVGGIFVYARSGGQLFRTPAQVSPAAVHDVNDPGGSPAIMMGTKSAPAFLAEPTPSPEAQQTVEVTPVTQISPQATLLPGSKSAVMISPEAPVQAKPVPAQAPQLLPGSKSIILVDPQSQSAPPLAQPVQRPRPTPSSPPLNNRTLLPGSKSRAVLDPQTFAPAPPPPKGQQQAVQANRQPAPRQAQPAQQRSNNRGIEQ
jgi:hypothetical protein